MLGASTLASQILGIVLLLALDRTSTVEEIGVYAEFLAITSLAFPLGLLGMQLAVPQVKPGQEEETGAVLLLVGVVTSGAFAAVLLILGYRFAPQASALFVATIITQIAEQIAIYDRRFTGLVINRVAPKVAMVIAIPVTQWVSDGTLDAETVIGVQTTILGLSAIYYFQCTTSSRLSFAEVTPRRTVTFLRTNSGLLVHVLPSQVLNLIAYQAPVILITRGFNASDAAQYSLTLRLCLAPIQLISSTFSQAIHFELGRAGRDQIKLVLARVTPFLLLASMVCFLALGICGPFVIEWLMGKEWEPAGNMTRIMSPMYALMLTAASVSSLFIILNQTKFILLSQAGYAIAALVSFGLGAQAGDLELGVVLFCVLGSLRYLIMLERVHRMVR